MASERYAADVLETSRRQQLDAAGKSVSVAMQHLVFLDKVCDMYDRKRVSKKTLMASREWALGSMFTTIGVAIDDRELHVRADVRAEVNSKSIELK